MPKIHSEIADNFAKLLEDAGITKQAYPNLSAYEQDSEARVGSDSISDIEIMYGVKPDAAEGQKYDHCIMEQAHPNSVIIAPSYDKVNGLVENNIERQNIIINRVLKPTEGNHTNPKYAHQQLTMELIRIANEMDSKNKEELFKLADECLIGLQKEAGMWDDAIDWAKKKFHDVVPTGEGALGGAGIGALIGALMTSWSGPGLLFGATAGAAAGGALAAFLKTGPQVKNVEENAREVSEQLKDLRSKVPEQSDFFDTLDKALTELISSSQQYQQVLNILREHSIKGQSESSTVNTAGDVSAITTKFLKDVDLAKKYHAEFDRRAKSGAFAKAEPGKALKPIYWFISDDIDDVSEAFVSLEDAIQKLEDATKTEVGAATTSTPATPSSAPAPTSAPITTTPKSTNQEFGDTFIKQFLGQ